MTLKDSFQHKRHVTIDHPENVLRRIIGVAETVESDGGLGAVFDDAKSVGCLWFCVFRLCFADAPQPLPFGNMHHEGVVRRIAGHDDEARRRKA